MPGFDFFGSVFEPRTAIDFSPTDNDLGLSAYAHRVYFRTAWEDDWVLQNDLFCPQASWAISPHWPHAELEWIYGRTINRSSLAWQSRTRYNPATNYYVKIEFDTYDASVLKWHGVVGSMQHLQDAVRTEGGVPVRTGVQQIQCIGLEKLLWDTRIFTGHVWDDDSNAALTVPRGLTFNQPGANGMPGSNRSLVKHDGSYRFSNLVNEDEQFWKVGDMVEHLLRHHAPHDKAYTQRITVTISAESLAILSAGQYRPIVPTEGQSLKNLLDQMIHRKRLTSYYLTINADNELEVKVVSLAPYTIASNAQLLALPNERQLNINFEGAQGDAATMVSQHEPVDRLRVRGAPVTATFTVSPADENWQKGWSDARHTVYQTAASGAAGYSAASTEEKQRMNAAVRNGESLRDVYAYFTLPNDWDGQSGGGEGEMKASIAPVIHAGEHEPAISPLFRREVYLRNTLPLLSGYNYQNGVDAHNILTPAELNDGFHEELPPFIYIKASNNKFYRVDTIGTASGASQSDLTSQESFNWAARIQVPPQSRGLYLQVHGEPQHILGKDDFTKLAADPTLGMWAWQDMVCTLCVELPGYCEAIYPPAAATPFTDFVREQVYYVGDKYRMDWLANYTVLGLESDGTLQKQSDAAWIRNDQPKLLEMAKLAFEWFALPRTSLQFTTYRPLASIQLGDMIRGWGNDFYEELNTVISTIQIQIPSSEGDQAPASPTITYTTDLLELPDFVLGDK